MDFIDKIQALTQKIEQQRGHIETEEATKNAFVMPFISALGYDVFNPAEVVPEFTADVGIKKGEKVDYAVMKDGSVIMLFECKACGANLDKVHMSQLYRYFSVTDARIGVLTNGIVYRFFSDLEKPNQMDSKPFLEFNLMDIQESLVDELKKLTKPKFDLEEILTTAGELKYTREMKHILEQELASPTDDFVKFFGSQVYSGRMTQSVVQQFQQITKRAFRQFINDQINKRLRSALTEEQEVPEKEGVESASEEREPEEETQGGKDIVTTEEEREGYFIVRAILREVLDVKRIAHRDRKSYFGILLDDNNRKPLCRLHFNYSQKYIGLFDNEKKDEERIPIESLDEVYKYADRLKKTVEYYEGKE